MEPEARLHPKCKLIALPANVRLGWKRQTMQELAPGARALAVVCRRGGEGVDDVVAAGVGEVVETDV